MSQPPRRHFYPAQPRQERRGIKPRTLIFCKPYKVLSSFTDPEGSHATLSAAQDALGSIVRPLFKELSPAQRARVGQMYAYTEEFGRTANRVPTWDELRRAFPDASDAELTGWWRVKQFYDTAYMVNNKRLYRDWNSRGFKTLYKGATRYHGTPLDAAGLRSFKDGNGFITVYDPERVKPVAMRAKDVEGFLKRGFQVIKLETPIKSSGREMHHLVLGNPGNGWRIKALDDRVLKYIPLDQQLSSPGANVFLTLDLKLQQEAEDCLAGKGGAIAALEPRTGKILALASSPPFSQEAFERGLSPYEWKRRSQHPDHPLENRVLKGQYPPGSTFKIVMAVAGLEEKGITPATVISCSGAMPFGNHVFHCWKKGGHGGMNLNTALVLSCDIYFYQVGRRLGIERIAKWSRRFGLGAPTGLRLDKEMPGLVASSAWKLARFKAPWQEGDTISVAIGQGYNLATPIQMAQVAAAVANGGHLYEPQLVARVESPAGEVLFQSQPALKSTLGACPANLALIQKALAGVVTEGTGKNARLPQVEVAGKTPPHPPESRGATDKRE